VEAACSLHTPEPSPIHDWVYSPRFHLHCFIHPPGTVALPASIPPSTLCPPPPPSLPRHLQAVPYPVSEAPEALAGSPLLTLIKDRSVALVINMAPAGKSTQPRECRVVVDGEWCAPATQRSVTCWRGMARVGRGGGALLDSIHPMLRGMARRGAEGWREGESLLAPSPSAETMA
jgi:hypothetical protein